MEFDWTTFFLEIINFLILIWILSRFLYRPILNAVNQRQTEIESRSQAIAAKELAAQELQQQYANRLTQWEQEKTTARLALQKEMDAERKRLLAEQEQSLAAERDKTAAVARRSMEDQNALNEKQALQQGAEFTARLLARLATPALEARIGQVLLEDIRALAREPSQATQALLQNGNNHITVVSAFELPTQLSDDLHKAMQQLAGRDLKLELQVDPALLAGIRINGGPWNLQASLRDELNYFVTSTHGRD